MRTEISSTASTQGQREVAIHSVSVRVSPFRLLFVTPGYFPYVGGVQNHVYQVSRRLAGKGIDVTVLTTNLDSRLPAEENAEGIHIRRVPAWPANRDYYFAPEIYRIIANGEWDIVHVQSYHTLVAPMAMLAAWRTGIPYVITFHGGGHSSRLRNSLRGVQKLFLRPLLARAERLVATAEFEIPLFSRQLRLAREKFVLIPNGGDLLDVMDTANVQVDENLIVSIGRLERYKGHHRVIAALPELLAQRPDLRLWIAGTGPYESNLWNLANKLGVAHRVEIHAVPAAERATMAKALSRAALVVLLSEYETQPMAVLEALALGRPVLVADTSGLSEIAQRGPAKAIPLESTPAEVAAAILEKLGQTNGLCPDLPTWDACAAKLLSLYRNIISNVSCT